MNLGSTCLGSKLERRCLQQYKKVSERGCFQLTKKVPDSSVFCCASPPKKDGQVFQAAAVASHQDFGFQTAHQRLGTIRKLSGQMCFSERCRDVPLDDAAVQGLERMLRVKARLETVPDGGETEFTNVYATAGESTKIVELHEVHESGGKSRCVSGAAESAAVLAAGESKGIFGLHEVNETDRMGTVDAVAAANAGESEGIIRLLEVFESDFPPLPNSSHAHNSCLRLSTSACARASWSAAACAGVAARVCPVSSSSAEFAVVHAHATTLHSAHNSWTDTGRVTGPTGTRRVKGGVSSPVEDLRPVTEVEAGVNFRPAGRAYGGRLQVHFLGGNQALVPGETREVWSHLPSTRRFLFLCLCHLDRARESGNRWAGRRCVEPHNRGFGC